ncbi:Rne/Rng family ribonuclease [Novispirillum itersonii]|uniref:Ribonuclease E n=1 Tax=Novispirillum itersonii TaxID=189 RepID=A0A7W9ZDW6_NOVIT|nr:ribonuclease E/G [Novispirillum itersonii]MBB6209661.1 ribonuclease E [Novispirillum itersonii]
MAKRMLMDATHPEETRVVVVNGTRLEQFDVETSTKKQLKGNVYLAKVVRVEPSLQAAFVEYGGNRHGFLAFSEIHPDYYQIPMADRQALLQAEADSHADDGDDDGDDVETLGGDDPEEMAPRSRGKSYISRNYKIQEVIKRRQIMLVQVVKEERGNKGAALTTYLSLAGRYCVLMPNTAKGGGVSRKITNAADRKRLKQVMHELDVPSQMAVILRTAGQERSKAEIKRDYEYLIRTWTQIRETTMESRAPALIHEEGNLIKRAIRDIYTSDIEEVLVDGDEGYRTAKDFMKILTPSHAKKVQPYRDPTMPLYHRYQVDNQLDAMHSPTVQLKSGGYIVINQTEALVAIDVNSGRSTKERHIEETALKTNLEAAEEIARQLRLRDLAGLIVIDFIDMEESKNNAAVERRLKDALKQDRARIQLGRISHFGLLELSRQRLRPSLMETSFHTCPHCAGTGMVRSVESAAVQILRVIEEEGVRRRSSEITVHVATPVALYVLNNKRKTLDEIEARYGLQAFLRGDDSLIAPDYRMDRVKADNPLPVPEMPAPLPYDPDDDFVEEDPVDEVEVLEAVEVEETSEARSDNENGSRDGDGKRRRKRRKRRRRGENDEAGSDGIRADGEEGDEADDSEGAELADGEGDDSDAVEASEGGSEDFASEDGREGGRRRRSRRGGRRRRRNGNGEAGFAGDEAAGDDVAAATEDAEEQPSDVGAADRDVTVETEEPGVASKLSDRPARRRVRRVRAADAATEAAVSEAVLAEEDGAPQQSADAEDTVPVAEKAPAKRRPSRKKAEAEADEAEKPVRRSRSRRKADEPAGETGAVVDGDADAAAVPAPIADDVVIETAGEPEPVAETAPTATPVPVTEPEDPDAPPRRGWWRR